MKRINLSMRCHILLLYVMILLSLFLVFRNFLLFKEDFLFAHSLNESSMSSYQFDGNIFIPIDETATILADGYNGNANRLDINFEKKLDENTTFILYNTSSEGEQLVVDQKNIRKGYKKISFDFKNQQINELKILAKSVDGSKYVNIPKGTIFLSDRKLSLNFNETYFFILIIICIFVSIILTKLCFKSDISETTNSRAKRDSNLELLRVICMILLVAHHFSVHGGLLNLDFSLAKHVGLIFLPVGKICFLAYIAISMYFLVDGKGKFIRFVKCWLEVAFYSVALTILTWAMGGCVSLKDLISSAFVMISNSHGFAASYLLFLLIYPFILKATKNCTKKQARYLLFIVFWIQIMSQILKTWTGYTQPVFSELTLFVFCYILSLNLKRYTISMLHNKWFSLSLVIVIYLYVYILNMIVYSGNTNEMTSFLMGITGDESSIFFIIGGYALFYLFKNIHIPHCNIINNIAAGTFGILLIHDHNFLRHIFWNEIVKTQIHFYSRFFIGYFLITVIVIFGVCSVIDFIRRKLLEDRLMSNKMIIHISKIMDGVLNE